MKIKSNIVSTKISQLFIYIIQIICIVLLFFKNLSLNNIIYLQYMWNILAICSIVLIASKVYFPKIGGFGKPTTI
jgi:hypothetical protein